MLVRVYTLVSFEVEPVDFVPPDPEPPEPEPPDPEPPEPVGVDVAVVVVQSHTKSSWSSPSTSES